MRPRLPSWTRSRSPSPRPMYFLAIDTTSRRFASTRRLRARSPLRTVRSRMIRSAAASDPASSSWSSARVPASACIASSTSCCGVSRGNRPISWRYIRTGSETWTSSSFERLVSASAVAESSRIGIRSSRRARNTVSKDSSGAPTSSSSCCTSVMTRNPRWRPLAASSSSTMPHDLVHSLLRNCRRSFCNAIRRSNRSEYPWGSLFASTAASSI